MGGRMKSAANESREARLERVLRMLLRGKPWAAFIATPEHPAGTGWTLEDEAKEALNDDARSAATCSRCGRESSVAAPGDVCGARTAKGNPCRGTFSAATVCPNCHGTGVTRFGVCTYCNGTGK
jgi:hypothetical protein